MPLQTNSVQATGPRDVTSEQIAKIRSQMNILHEKTATAGFDGFIDTLLRIIRNKNVDSAPQLFNEIGEFGEYILTKRSASFSLETEPMGSRIGGNMPIMSNAMGNLGVNVNCIGAFGHPSVSTVFETMSSKCQLYSFADAGVSTAFEFNDGKMMLAQMGELNSCDWETIKQRISLSKLKELFEQSDLLCLVNWSEIDQSSNIWAGMLSDIMPSISNKQRRICFFDLSDCSKRSVQEINLALELMHKFSAFAEVVIGLNLNEVRVVYQSLFGQSGSDDMTSAGTGIYTKIKPSRLLLHSARQSVIISAEGITQAATFYEPEPTYSTGAGDNFNAGFCIAMLLQLENTESLLLANGVAGYYVRNGKSPDPESLLRFLEQQIKKQ